MRPLSIFVSSTCFDLKALREHIRSEIVSMGHEPILSEYSSFPVLPDISAIDNCKKVVKERADVFVLIVGGKRGSLDPQSLRSVVNEEYREARAAGLDCVIFVDRQVWNLLPIYRKNSNADFTPTVDDSAIFVFLEEIRAASKWVFQFSDTDESIVSLKHQLSIRFRDLLIRASENRLTVPLALVGESESIIRIAIEKRERWEYLLASELLRDRIGRIDAKFADLDSGFVVRRTKFVEGRDAPNYLQDLMSDLANILGALTQVLNEQLSPAFGPPGVAGDAEKIKVACDNLYALFLSLFEWEIDVRFVRSHKVFEDVFSIMRGWSAETISEFRRITAELNHVALDTSVTGTCVLQLTINPPKGIDDLTSRMVELSKDASVLAAIGLGL